ncbi:MAG: tyrosine-type recombinase/integrase [Desulfobacteraceae bacterium]|nr:tyrosine-type recombinase/integrase [Desulfobacteraceae bacterium]
MDQLLSRWAIHLRILRGLSAKSIAVYRRQVDEFFIWRKSEDIASVRRKEIERYMEHLFYKSNANATRAKKLGALTGFFRFCVYEGLLKEDPAHNVPKPRVWRKLIQALTKSERLRMFEHINYECEKGLRDAAVMILLTFGGLRIGEIAGLRLHDLVNDDNKVMIQLPDNIVKHHSSRVVDLWQAPSELLWAWVQLRYNAHSAKKTAPVFISYYRGDRLRKNRCFEARDIRRLVSKLAAAADIRRVSVHPHMFRASHGSDLRHIEGYDIVAIAARLGHRNIATTDRYLPQRRRVGKKYRSLRHFWLDWERLIVKGGKCEG